MASTQADPGTFPGGNTHSPNPGWRNRTLHFVATWWPALFTGAAAIAVASFLYVASALAFTQAHPDYSIGFGAFGLFINAMPPAIVWATMKWVR